MQASVRGATALLLVLLVLLALAVAWRGRAGAPAKASALGGAPPDYYQALDAPAASGPPGLHRVRFSPRVRVREIPAQNRGLRPPRRG